MMRGCDSAIADALASQEHHFDSNGITRWTELIIGSLVSLRMIPHKARSGRNGGKLPEREKQRRVSHVARNPEAVGAKGDRLSLCGRVVPVRALTAQPSADTCCDKCRKAWLKHVGPGGAVMEPPVSRHSPAGDAAHPAYPVTTARVGPESRLQRAKLQRADGESRSRREEPSSLVVRF
jgi:hypothetical protein